VSHSRPTEDIRTETRVPGRLLARPLCYAFTMKPPKGPFWAWIDIDGSGEKWHMAHVTTDGEASEIHYPLDDFDDYWYDDDWEHDDIRPINTPAPRYA
jgi:hypothetical protein